MKQRGVPKGTGRTMAVTEKNGEEMEEGEGG